MTHTYTVPKTAPQPLSSIAWKVAWPFFLFSVVLVGLLALSWSMLLPRYTRIQVGGELRSVQDIIKYKSDLTAQIAAKEEERYRLVLAVHDPAFDALKEMRRDRMTADDVRAALIDHAKKVTERDDVVSFSSVGIDASQNIATIQGDVHNVDVRSMTTLAAFASSLTELPFVTSATTPQFTRLEDAKTGPHSPFSITLTLK